MKALLKFFIVFVLLFTSVQNVFAATYYEKVQKENISKNMTYESAKTVTDKGLLDIFVLKVPLKDPYIKVKPTISLTSYGLKETLSKLLVSNGALAGVNADFFDMTGTHSNPVGSLIIDGKLISADIANNMSSPYYGTFMLDKNSNPFIDYVKFDIYTKFNGYNIHIAAYNEVSDMAFPVVVNNIAMKNTSALDAKFPGLAKIVVQNGTVKETVRGNTVEVPDDGYLVLMNSAAADAHFPNIGAGQPAELSITANVNHNELQTAIGGAGRILKDGAVVADNGFVPSGRQPRTAVGYTKDGSQLILMVVDGRTHSVGATHEELGQLLLKYGAYNAMHFDGGGSSAMGIKASGASQATLVNAPQGGERRILNALGIYRESPTGQLSQLIVKPQNTKVFNNTGIPINITGADDYLNTVAIPKEQLAVAFSDQNGRFSDGMFYPSIPGKIDFTASYGGFNGSTQITSMKLAALTPTVSSIKSGVGVKTELGFGGISDKGEKAYIYSNLNYEISPPGLGHMEGRTFVADQLGAGYIKASLGDVAYYIDISVGSQTKQLNGLDGNLPVKFVGFPENVQGKAEYSSATVKEGSKALELKYQFGVSESTQAAYAAFVTPYTMAGNPTRLSLWVNGDNSNSWLRAKLIDANKKDITLDLAREVNWSGWKQVSVNVPTDVRYPVALDRIYVASLAGTPGKSGTLVFDDLQGDVSGSSQTVAVPQSTAFVDQFKTTLADKGPGFDITIAGNIKAEEAEIPLQQKILQRIQQNTSLAVIAGSSENIGNLATKSVIWNGSYSYMKQDNVALINLAAGKGGIVATNPSQWASLLKDIKESNADHVLIMTDLSPIRYAQSKEYDLLQDALTELNKNIFVISTDAAQNTLNVRDGIRYINISGIKQDPKILRFRVNGTNINYDFQSVN